MTTSGVLYVVATPIGNGADLSARARSVLAEVGCIACEDTRTVRRLLAGLGIEAPRLTSLYEHNEAERVDEVLGLLHAGADVALVSEAGTPTVSDPGYRLVARCAEAGVRVSPVPGPCAAIAALSASGLPTDRFLFLGFPPKRGGRLRAFVASVVEPGRTAIVYVPARDVAAVVEEIGRVAPAARLVVARELTKTFEEFVRGTPAELLTALAPEKQRGECVLLCHTGRRDDVTEA